MNVNNLRNGIDVLDGLRPVRATTPHGTYLFDVVSFTLEDNGALVLDLVERPKAPTKDEAWESVIHCARFAPGLVKALDAWKDAV